MGSSQVYIQIVTRTYILLIRLKRVKSFMISDSEESAGKSVKQILYGELCVLHIFHGVFIVELYQCPRGNEAMWTSGSRDTLD